MGVPVFPQPTQCTLILGCFYQRLGKKWLLSVNLHFSHWVTLNFFPIELKKKLSPLFNCPLSLIWHFYWDRIHTPEKSCLSSIQFNGFNRSTKFCRHQHNLTWGHFHHPQNKPSIYSLFFSTPGIHYPFLTLRFLPNFDISYKRNHSMLVFCDCLLSLRLFSGFIVVECINVNFLLNISLYKETIWFPPFFGGGTMMNSTVY